MVLDYRDRCAHSTPGVAERTGAGAEPSHERRLRNSPRLSRCTHMTNNLPPDTGTQPQDAPDTKLTLTEVAEVTGRDIKTIKVWNDKGKGRWPNAVQDTTGRKAWRVPVSDSRRRR